MKLLLQSFTLTHALALSLLGGFILTTALQAAPMQPSSATSIYYTPPPLPDRGAPGGRGAGGSRGCAAGSHPLTALVPEQTVSTASNTAPITQVWGLTDATHPSFWFSVPYDPAKVSAIEFILQNNQDQTIYRTLIPVPSAPGIVSVKLPPTASGLEVNQQYHWFFKVRTMCEPSQPPALNYVEGWVQRTRLEQGLSDRLTHATPQQRAALYAENGIWYDALTTLAELKLAKPGDGAIAQDWMDLLKSVSLENLATQPLIR